MIKFHQSLSKDEWPEVKKFISNHYRNDHPILNKKFFFWLGKAKKRINIFCLKKDNKILSIMGYTKIPMRINQKIVPTVWLHHWISDKKFIGAGAYLLNKIEKKKNLLFTMNASKLGKQFYTKKRNWKGLDQVQRNVIILNKKKLKKLFLKKFKNINLKYYLLDYDKIITKNQNTKFELKNFNVDWKKYVEMKSSVVRDRKFINWRYFKHPVFKYKIFTAGPKKHPCVCIFRIEKIYGKLKGKIARIVDFYYPLSAEGDKHAKVVLSNVINFLVKENCIFVDYFSTSKIFSKMFNFFSINKKEKKDIFITKFSPILNENYSLNIFYKLSKNYHLGKKMYFTKADIDGDGPVRI